MRPQSSDGTSYTGWSGRSPRWVSASTGTWTCYHTSNSSVNAPASPSSEYLFKHALTQEVAYGGLARSERRRIHLLVAKTIESEFVDRRSEFVELLAHHYLQARQHDKAAHYWSAPA